ncbi:MAG: DNRLRE domain-containing protein, partial [Anaerolineae bacterium]|nr:DNRLRE domain-containing protein [Anaerolineae bacterium]
MKPRFVALLLLAFTLLLVGMIPAVGAQPATPERQAPHNRPTGRERDIEQQANPWLEAPLPEEMSSLDPIRAERHPESIRQLEIARPVAPLTGRDAANRVIINAPITESEPNDDWTTATPIAVGDVASGAIDPGYDEDYYAISVTAGDIIRFSITAESNGSWLDSYLYLYDTDGTSWLADDYNTNGLDAELTYFFNTTGVYYLMVAEQNDGDGGPDYFYELAVTDALDIDTTVVRASVDELGLAGNDYSYKPDLSADGRYVAFYSYADDLVPGDWNGFSDVFVRDLQTNTIERVSVSTGGEEGNDYSSFPSISDDGRYVVFYSYADNLVAGDTGWSSDIFLHDRITGVTTLISRHTDGTQGNWDSYEPAISGDGQFVTYYSYADNLVDVDSNGDYSDVFVYEIATEITTLVSTHNDGTQGNNGSYEPVISGDGQVIAFESWADNLVDNDTNDQKDVFVHDVTAGTTTLVSRHSDGTQGNSQSFDPAISSDGEVVVFTSYADNLVSGAVNSWEDIFAHDLTTGDTTLVSRHSDGTPGDGYAGRASVSSDGRFVSFESISANLLDYDANGDVTDIFLHDRQAGLTTLVSESASGSQGNWYSGGSSINGDGTVIAYDSMSNNLVPYDDNGWTRDIFVRFTDQANLHAITGRVVDEYGYGLGWQQVRDISGAAVLTNQDGYYFLAGLLPGDHGVWVDSYYDYYVVFSDTPVPVTVPPDASNVDFVGYYPDTFLNVYEPVADAYVDQAKTSTNYGTKPYLRVKNASKDLETYLKFDINDLPSCAEVDSSRLGLYATDPGPDGGKVFFPSSDDWTETGITWNNAPGHDPWYWDSFGAVTDESYNWAYVYPATNGVSSFVVWNDSSDQVQYQSREDVNPPQLEVNWYQLPDRRPDAQYGMNTYGGLAPLTVQFTDQSAGCATTWEWDFGDGYTSTDRNPTHTYTTPGYYEVVLTITNSEGTDKKTQWVEVVEPPDQVFMSLSKKLT